MTRLFRPKVGRYKRLFYNRDTKRVVETQFPQSFLLDKTWTTKQPLEEKYETYECGEDPEGEAHIQFHFQYYMFAIMFVVFDVLIAFIFAWALVFPLLSIWAKLFMMLFMLILVVAVIYSLKKEEVIWI